jgi:hypothetical protein
VGLAALLAAPLMATSVARPAPSAYAAVAIDPENDPFWGIYVQVLELVFRLLNGMDGPQTEPTTAEGWITLIAESYHQNGAPVLSLLEEIQARITIETAYKWSVHFEDIVDPNSTLVLQETLRALYIDLGGNPANLE